MLRYLKVIITAILFFLSPVSQTAFGQVPVSVSENKVIIEGKIYFIHIVKPGQTLYSISRAYRVSEKAIAIENPGVYSGLQVGQVLKIPSESPENYSGEIEIDTLNFISHRLKEGETLFSLSRNYNVSVNEIEKANPGIDVTDLSIDQIILIPKLKTVRSDENFTTYKVRRKETMYSLSRRYGISEEDLRKYNPEIQWGGLKAGMVLKIPRLEFLAEEKAKSNISVIKQDTIISFRVDTTKTDLSYIDSLGLVEMSLKDYYRNLKDFNRRKLKIAYLIPFNYRIIEDTIVKSNELNELSKEEEKEKEADVLPASINFLEFFEGTLLALDSLKREGISLEIQYFDTYMSPSRVREILRNPFFNDVDLIIGPLFAYNVEIVSEFSRERKIPVISPFYDGYDITRSNPYLFQVNPSYKTEYAKAAEILAKDYDKNFVFVYRLDSLKLPEIEYFRNELLENLENYTHPENVVIKEISYVNAAKANLSEDLSHALSKDKTNIIVLPENNQAFVSTTITQLFFLLRDFDIKVFGLPYFHEFQNIDFQYYHSLRLSYLSPFYFSYYDEQVSKFLNDFVIRFNAEPRLSTKKGCPYAFIGYDITYFFIKRISEYDRGFVSSLNDGKIDNLLPQFYFERNDEYGGFENKSLKLVEFTTDFQVTARDIESRVDPSHSHPQEIFHSDNNQ